jgi:hypothetical protein
MILGSIAGLFGLLGAVLAANAIDTGMYLFGFGLIGFAVLYGFWLIKDHFDCEERSRARESDEARP